MIGLLMRDAGILGAITTAVAPIALAACSMAPPARETAQRAPVVAGWPAIPARTKFGQVSAVDVDSHGHVFVLHRAGQTLRLAQPVPARHSRARRLAREGREVPAVRRHQPDARATGARAARARGGRRSGSVPAR